ncbi:ABC transporter substrate-binding protein [Pseudactinotalea sp. HY158]|uniref:ABC transporter substrate-binding protein n=1 Tax=Pseudactinotalea sp. HY158 TaxID=2654547 RepID=UPI00129D0365|nr:extracellular solute-binding protein [Pseudactinotalea sp. HY158]QGH68457.1 extracellular solute-binding protein [Pseudactinotalea sp. HY158]
MTRKSKFKQNVLVGTIILSATALAACGSSGGDSTNADGKLELVVANSQWLDALRGENLWGAVKAYDDAQSEVVLVQQAIPSESIDTKIATELGAGQGPDIMIIQDKLFMTVRDALLPIDDVVAEAENLNETNDAAIVDGEYRGVAWQRAAYALIYNELLLEEAGVEPPTNVDELIEAGQAVQEATGTIGFASRHSVNEITNWYFDFQNWLQGYGGGIAPDGTFAIDSPENVAAVEAFKQVYDADIIPKGDDFPTQRTRMKEGGIAMSIDNSGGTLNIASGASEDLLRIGAAPLPFDHPGAHQQLFVAINKNISPEKQEAAKDFIRWFIGPEAQDLMRSVSGPDRLATDVPIPDDVLTESPWMAAFEQAAVASNSTLVSGHEGDTAQVARIVMEAVEQVLTGDADAATVLADAQQQTEAAFADD